MRERAFRSFLTSRIGGRAVSSYLSNLRAVERLLGIDLDIATLDVPDICGQLTTRHMPAARARDCGSALRQYLEFLSIESTQRVEPVVDPKGTVPLFDVTGLPVAELMRLYAGVLQELRQRDVLRTENGPVGDYAEWLFARGLNWTLVDNSAARYDARDASNVRYQIKGRRVTGAGSRQLGAIRRLPDRGFDVLAAVLFDRNMRVLRAALIPHEVVTRRAKRVEHTNSWRFMLSDAVWEEPAVRDVTTALRAAES